MTPKRRNLSGRALAEIDQLLDGYSVHEETSCSVASHAIAPSTEKESNPRLDLFSSRKQSKSVTSGSSDGWRESPLDTNSSTLSSSLGGCEMDLLRRKDEATADMSLFLAKAISRTSSIPSLEELLLFLSDTGTSQVLLALKRVGAVETFIGHLTNSHYDRNHQRCLLYLLLQLFPQVSAEAFFQVGVVRFLVQALEPRVTPVLAAASEAVHWSQRVKKRPRTTAVSPTSTRDASAEDLVQQRLITLFGGDAKDMMDASTSSPELSLRLLLAIAFAHNESSLAKSSADMAVLAFFVDCGGFQQVAKLLESPTAYPTTLSLLEVITTSEALQPYQSAVVSLVTPLVQQLSFPLTNGDDVSMSCHRIRVLTNLTNLHPSCIVEGGAAQRLADFIGGILVGGVVDAQVELITFALCCCVNIVKWEAASQTSQFTSALLRNANVISTAATRMVELYASADVERIVLSGYFALFLGVVSLSSLHDGESLRVPVVTAIADATRDTDMGKKVERHPMKLVVAILQEFLLFQSQSGILTKSALLEIHELLKCLMKSNQIEVPAAPPKHERSDSLEVNFLP